MFKGMFSTDVAQVIFRVYMVVEKSILSRDMKIVTARKGNKTGYKISTHFTIVHVSHKQNTLIAIYILIKIQEMNPAKWDLLMVSTLWVNSACEKKKIIFLLFPGNRVLHFMETVSLGDDLHEMLSPIFREN